MKKPEIRGHGGFTLVELMVVIGIIAILIAMLLPSLAAARNQSKRVACESNERQIGIMLQMYANNWRGWLYPPLRGANLPDEERWPVYVFKPAVYNPPIMICPSDVDNPAEQHSYLLNNHLYEEGIKQGSKVEGRTPSDVIVLGEKKWDYPDYYMNSTADTSDYATRVEPWRHGIRLGSNYLFMDWHVEAQTEKQSLAGVDPWSFPDPDKITLPPN